MILFTMILMAGTGLLFVGLAIPLIMGKIPPNPTYGFRVAKTMSNPDIWYPANRYCGWTMLAAGVVTSVAAVVLALIKDLNLFLYVMICVGIMSTALIVAAVMSFMYLQKL